MRRAWWHGACVALAIGAWAGAETLDEAIERLAKAAGETRDLKILYAVQGIQPASMAATEKAAQKRNVAGTGEFLMLREGDKCLQRLATNLTIEIPGQGEKAPPTRTQRKTVSINDGQTLWLEDTKRPGENPVQVQKQRVPARGGLRLRSSLSAIDSPYTTSGLKAEMKTLGELLDLKLAGKGTVAGRPATTFEFAVKPDRLKAWGEGRRAAAVARSLVEIDDATGAALAIKDFNAAGELLRSVTANEVKANAGLDKKLFAYAPPEGVKVTDLNAPPETPKAPEKQPKAP
jgi:outer membrane lipoprotein-sorting protein